MIWKNRIKKFIDNPLAIWPFLKKRIIYNYIADSQISSYSDVEYLDYKETIDEAIAGELSIIRFGDELFDMLNGIGLYYGDWRQKYNPGLVRRLKEVLHSNNPKILMCFNFELILKSKKEFKHEGITEQYHFWTNSKMFLKNYLHTGRVYGSALAFNTRYNSNLNFLKIKTFLEDKNIVILTSNTKRFKDIVLGKTIDFIECPKSDAWDSYERLYREAQDVVVKKEYEKENVLFFISLASTAKIMVFDLTKNGYIAWDVGQFFDISFEQNKKTFTT